MISILNVCGNENQEFEQAAITVKGDNRPYFKVIYSTFYQKGDK